MPNIPAYMFATVLFTSGCSIGEGACEDGRTAAEQAWDSAALHYERDFQEKRAAQARVRHRLRGAAAQAKHLNSLHEDAQSAEHIADLSRDRDQKAAHDAIHAMVERAFVDRLAALIDMPKERVDPGPDAKAWAIATDERWQPVRDAVLASDEAWKRCRPWGGGDWDFGTSVRRMQDRHKAVQEVRTEALGRAVALIQDVSGSRNDELVADLSTVQSTCPEMTGDKFSVAYRQNQEALQRDLKQCRSLLDWSVAEVAQKEESSTPTFHMTPCGDNYIANTDANTLEAVVTAGTTDVILRMRSGIFLLPDRKFVLIDNGSPFGCRLK